MVQNNKIKKLENQFIVKSNIITRAVRSPNATIMTMRLFAFGLAKLSEKIYQIKKDYIEYHISLADFAKYYDFLLSNLYEKVEYHKNETNVIKKEMKIISSFQLETSYFDEPDDFDFTNLFLDCGHRKKTGNVYFKMRKDIFDKHFVNQIQNFTKFYLPYTKFITTKYTWSLYEYLRSHLYVSSKTRKSVAFEHQLNLNELSKILNLGIKSSYFKKTENLKNRILEPVKKDLLNTDVIMDYKIIKTGRKNTHIKFYTKLDMKKFAEQLKSVYGDTSNNYVEFQKNYNKVDVLSLNKNAENLNKTIYANKLKEECSIVHNNMYEENDCEKIHIFK